MPRAGRRRPRRRRPGRKGSPDAGSSWGLGIGLVVLVGGLLVQGLRLAVDWLTTHWYVTVLVLAAVVVGSVGWARERGEAERWRRAQLLRLRVTVPEIDGFTPTRFEQTCAELLRRDGWAAEHVGRSYDQCADVKASDEAGRRMVVQCKHRTSAARVGPSVVREVHGTARHVHAADIAVIVTNGGFTAKARAEAESFGIHLVDREVLTAWAERGIPLTALLALDPPSPSAPRR